jgi:hypothetical protein
MSGQLRDLPIGVWEAIICSSSTVLDIWCVSLVLWEADIKKSLDMPKDLLGETTVRSKGRAQGDNTLRMGWSSDPCEGKKAGRRIGLQHKAKTSSVGSSVKEAPCLIEADCVSIAAHKCSLQVSMGSWEVAEDWQQGLPISYQEIWEACFHGDHTEASMVNRTCRFRLLKELIVKGKEPDQKQDKMSK